MNLLLSCIGKRGYLADFFRAAMGGQGKIIGTSHTSWTPGFQACDEAVVLPPIASDEYLPALLDLCQRHDIQGLLSLYDPDVLRLASAYQDFLNIGVQPVLPPLAAATIAFDKLATYRFLSERHFLTPLTTDSLEVAEQWLAAGSMQFPLIVKPRCGFGSFNTFLAHNLQQLRAFFHYAPDMIVQSFVDGEAINVDGLSDFTGRALSIVPWKKLLSRQGETERAITIEDPELLHHGVHLMEALGVVGPMDADLFRTADGKLWTLELNLRFGGGYPVSHLAGASFPQKILSLLSGHSLSPDLGRYTRGVTMMKQLHIIPGPNLADR
jgi:carbamoyl-phosphate synthase large subunit